MKYIDASKLIAEIKRQKHELELSIQSYGDYGQSCHIVAYDNILSLIDYLQQEQRETDGDYGKFVKILVRKEFAEQIQKLGDEIQAGQSSFVGAMNQQGRPDVELETEIEKELRLHYNDDQDVYWWNYLKNSFRHFYELGRKQVLQEIYDGKTKPVDKITAAWLDD